MLLLVGLAATACARTASLEAGGMTVDQICNTVHSPLGPTVCVGNIVYDCMKKKVQEDCGATSRKCITWAMGGTCKEMKDKLPPSASSRVVSVTLPPAKSTGTYSPQRLCNAPSEPNDATSKLYQVHPVKSVCADAEHIYHCDTGVINDCHSLFGSGSSCCSLKDGTASCCNIQEGLRNEIAGERSTSPSEKTYTPNIGEWQFLDQPGAFATTGRPLRSRRRRSAAALKLARQEYTEPKLPKTPKGACHGAGDMAESICYDNQVYDCVGLKFAEDCRPGRCEQPALGNAVRCFNPSSSTEAAAVAPATSDSIYPVGDESEDTVTSISPPPTPNCLDTTNVDGIVCHHNRAYDCFHGVFGEDCGSGHCVDANTPTGKALCVNKTASTNTAAAPDPANTTKSESRSALDNLKNLSNKTMGVAKYAVNHPSNSSNQTPETRDLPHSIPKTPKSPRRL